MIWEFLTEKKYFNLIYFSLTKSFLLVIPACSKGIE